ncbi:uncharacterized protein BHQ10_010386 [Talaromyces amestolkiae]|uniref:Uncharacterized protein n=1 Tax=Talaromyces amestolkiae TaxID=1196081 RepID=A0A364LF14_TALAM|nr:uncharacterized protein BHQ10_010386 [Talaromyces amestolkiae]RAO74374.1 hypothetical protein BHQ10_010386 [Talaromyces amestolkiae]
MEEGAVTTPLTGENLVPQGVRRDATAPQQNTTHQHHQEKGFAKMEDVNATASILQWIEKAPNTHINHPTFVNTIRNIQIYASSHGESTEAITDLRKLVEQIQWDMAIVRARTEPSTSSATTGLSSDSATPWKEVNTRKWQNRLSIASPPLSTSVGTSTPGVTQAELSIDCEIVVKVRDEAIRKDLAKESPEQLVQRAERARALQTPHAVAAKVMRQHAEKWVRAFGDNAFVRVPTWGVVIDGVPVHTVNLKNEDFKQQLIAQNQHSWGYPGVDIEIAYVGWLARPHRRESSLVVEFTHPIIANNALTRNTDLVPKCANYKGNHKAISANCPVRKIALERAKEALDRVLRSDAIHRVPKHLLVQEIEPAPQEAANMAAKKTTTTMTHRAAPKSTKAATKSTTTTRTKRTKTQHQEATTAPAEPAPEPPVDLTVESIPEPAQETAPTTAPTTVSTTALETAPQSTPQDITESVDELIAQRGVEPPAPPPTKRIPTRPSTPEAAEASDMETPLAPTIVRAATIEPKRTVEPYLQKRGRGRPPKSKSSNNDEQPLEPAASVEAALAITHPEEESPATVDPRMLQTNPQYPFTGGPPLINRRAGRIRPPSIRQAAAKRRREQSREASVDNDNQLPPLPPMTMNLEPNNVTISSGPIFREIDSEQPLSSDYNELLQSFVRSGQRIRDYQSQNGQNGRTSRQSMTSQSTDELA